MANVMVYLAAGFFFLGCSAWAGEGTPEDKDRELLLNTRFISLTVEQSYGGAEGIDLPFSGTSTKVLRGCGFGVREPGAGAGDGRLSIKVQGTPLSKKYGKGIPLYTGAKIQGRISFAVRERELYEAQFEWVESPPWMLHTTEKRFEELKKPTHAPFSDLFEDNFHLELGRMVYKLWSIEPLTDSLKANRDWKIRKGLIHFLGQTKDSRAIGPLAEALEGSGTNVAHHVSKALSNFGDAGCEALIKVLEQGPINQRDDAARALGWMDNQRATVPLIKAVAWYRENKDFVPSSFFWALGMLEDKRSVETLIEALQYTRDYTRRRVADALERITGESFGEDRVKWLEWWNKVKQSSCKDGA